MKKWIDPYDNNKYIKEKEDYIEAFGGDGTLIKAIHMYENTKKPFFGIAGGTLNFLMNEEINIKSNASYETFNLIEVEVEYEIDDVNGYITGKRKKTFNAFNDIVLGDFNGWIDFNCKHEDNILGSFKGSGIIISTSQGSTGINKNNHGTILPLSSKNWSVTGMQTNRNINYIIDNSSLEIICSSRFPIRLFVDGRYKIINNVKKVKMKKGREVVVIFNNYQKFKEKRQ